VNLVWSVAVAPQVGECSPVIAHQLAAAAVTGPIRRWSRWNDRMAAKCAPDPAPMGAGVGSAMKKEQSTALL
jgi:hypothetical protein